METQQVDSNKKISEYEKSLGEFGLLISQHEARMKSMREAENKKRTREEQIDSLRECAELKAAEHVSAVNAEDKKEELREAYIRQLSELRDEIAAKQHEINEMKDVHQKLLLAHKQNHSYLKNGLEQLSKRLRTTMERVNALETAMKELKEDVIREGKRASLIYEALRAKSSQFLLARASSPSVAAVDPISNIKPK